MPFQLCGKVIGLRADKVEEYKRLHAAVWPGGRARIRACHLRNFSIFLRRLPDRAPGEWWAEMEEICHLD